MSENSAVIQVGNWGKLLHDFGSGGIPVPFVKEILLMEVTHIAGTGFVKDLEKKTAMLEPGSMLEFRRDPQNKYDCMAIQILNDKKERIGFVPRCNNEIPARLMDAGKLIFGRVRKKEVKGNWHCISIQIFMRDL